MTFCIVSKQPSPNEPCPCQAEHDSFHEPCAPSPVAQFKIQLINKQLLLEPLWSSVDQHSLSFRSIYRLFSIFVNITLPQALYMPLQLLASTSYYLHYLVCKLVHSSALLIYCHRAESAILYLITDFSRCLAKLIFVLLVDQRCTLSSLRTSSALIGVSAYVGSYIAFLTYVISF